MLQRSDEWFAARLGKVTASNIKKVMATIKSGEAADRRNYRAQLVVERLTGTKQDSFANSAMEWGTQQEPSARDAYSFISGYEVSEIGFVDHPEIAMAGASPDGLIAQDGLVEIKCPNTATHIDWMLSGNVPKEHELQILFQMDCTGRKWCDFVSYDPRLPIDLQLFVVRMEFDKNRALEIKESVKQFIAEVDKTVSDLLSISQQEEI